jgi:hypothetical protein
VVTAVLALVWFVLNGTVLWGMAFVSQRLLHQFKQAYPDLAEREIPRVFEGVRHPEQFLYFYRRRAAQVLKDDPRLLRLRRRLVVLTWLAVTLPIPTLIALAVAIRVSR